jgi:hypothetical protein
VARVPSSSFFLYCPLLIKVLVIDGSVKINIMPGEKIKGFLKISRLFCARSFAFLRDNNVAIINHSSGFVA